MKPYSIHSWLRAALTVAAAASCALTQLSGIASADMPAPPESSLFLDGHPLGLTSRNGVNIRLDENDRVVIGVPLKGNEWMEIGSYRFKEQRFFVDGVTVGVGIIIVTSAHRVALVDASRHVTIDGVKMGEVSYDTLGCTETPGVRITDTHTLLIRPDDSHAIFDGRDMGFAIEACEVRVSGNDILFIRSSSDEQRGDRGFVNGREVGPAEDIATSGGKILKTVLSTDEKRLDLFVDEKNLSASTSSGLLFGSDSYVFRDGHVIFLSQATPSTYTVSFDGQTVGTMLKGPPMSPINQNRFDTAGGRYGFINEDSHIIIDGRDQGEGSNLHLDGNQYAFVRRSTTPQTLVHNGVDVGPIGRLDSEYGFGYDDRPFHLSSEHLVYAAPDGHVIYDGIDFGAASHIAMSKTHLVLSYPSLSEGERAGTLYPGYAAWEKTSFPSMIPELAHAMQEGRSSYVILLSILLGVVVVASLIGLFFLRRHRTKEQKSPVEPHQPSEPPPTS